MRVYVASSWRNKKQPGVVSCLRDAGHMVYDFRNPAPGMPGFAWSEIDPDWQKWSTRQFREALNHPRACQGFHNDFGAMIGADAFVLVLPCGRSAHLELGWAVGKVLKTCILLDDAEPELMYKMVDRLCVDMAEVLHFLGGAQ